MAYRFLTSKKKKLFWCLISNQYHKFPKKHNYLLNSNMITWQYFCMINSNQSKSLDVCYSARSQFQTQNSNLMKYHTMENNTDKMVSWQLPPSQSIAPNDNCTRGKLLPEQLPLRKIAPRKTASQTISPWMITLWTIAPWTNASRIIVPWG